MPQISIGDITGSAQLDIAPASRLAKSLIHSLTASVRGLVDAFPKPVASSRFERAGLGAVFQQPSIPLSVGALGIKAGVNASLALIDSIAGPLFGADDYDPIAVTSGDYWLAFELDTLLDASVGLPLPYGFGVGFNASTAPGFTTYLLIPKASAGSKTLREATGDVLNSFSIPDTPDSIMDVPGGIISTCDLSGAITISGSWSLPIAVNQLSLAGAHLPFNANVSVSPAVALKVAGNVSISSEFNVRVRRVGATSIRFGAYRKHGSQLAASFTAAAGITADLGGTDLVNAFLTAIDSGIDHKGLSADDRSKIGSVLKSSIDHSLSLSLSAACSAAAEDEAAILYEIDVTARDIATHSAIESALKGDWKPLSELPNAKKLRNVIIDTVEKKTTLRINILGLYNYESVSDFLSELRVVQDFETGAVVITDTLTAKQITTASNPLAADGDKLASAMYQSFLATCTYQALMAGHGTSPNFSAKQDLLLYRDQMSYREALKQLNTGEALEVLSPAVKSALAATGAPVRQARFHASTSYNNDDVLSFFFSNVDQLTPRAATDVKLIGRKVLASLLDPQNPIDNARIQTLQSDSAWTALENNPTATSVSHSDWFDIVTWAEAITAVATPLANAIQAARASEGDPSTNPDFMKKRAALTLALEGVARNTKGAFEKGFPICVMSAVRGARTSASNTSFEAGWNSKIIFSTVSGDKPTAKTLGAG